MSSKPHKEMVIAIGTQGGWQGYEREFCRELRLIPEEFTRNGNFRKAEFVLLPAVKQGIQIADFYVGAIREFHRSQHGSLLSGHQRFNRHFITRGTYKI